MGSGAVLGWRGESAMELQKWKTQLRKGLLDLCVLNFLGRREYYGYDLVQELKHIDGLHMREGTIYPILARLQEDGLVNSEVRGSSTGPARKYFNITPAGEKAIADMNKHWDLVERAVQLARREKAGGDE